MDQDGLDFFNLFINRLDLKKACLRSGDSFEEDIYWDVNNMSLTIKVVLGGEEKGFYGYRHIYDFSNLYKESNEFYSELLEGYLKFRK